MRFQLFASVWLSVAVIACTTGSTSPAPTGSASPGATASGSPGVANGEIPTLRELVEQTAWPLVHTSGPGVAVELAPSGKSAMVGPSGGSVEVTASDGTRYVLTIPANALTFETTVTLTPVAAITGYTVEADAMYGVDIAPHGLVLWNAATLQVVPPSGTDIAQAVGLAYHGNGDNLHRTPLGRDPSKLEMVLAHFSGGLVYVGDGIYLPAPPAPEPRSYADLEKAVAEALERERSGDATAEETSATLEALFDEYLRESLMGEASLMREDCEYGKRHIGEYIGFMRQAQLLGMDYVVERYTDDINASGLIGDVLAKCWEDASGDCVRYDPRQIRELIGLVRQAGIIGRDLDVEQYAPTVCGNTGGQVEWSSEGHQVRTGNPWTLTTDDHFAATIWVTGQFSEGVFEDRGSRYTYQGLSTLEDVGGGCDVHFVGRTFGEGQALDVYLEIDGSDAYFSATVDGTNHGHRVDCDESYSEDQPNFGAIVTCPDESGGVMGTFEPDTRQVTIDCDHTQSEDGDGVTGTSSFAAHGFLTISGYEEIVDFIKAQAQQP